MWGLAYAACMVVLFVRFGPPEHRPVRPKAGDPLALVQWHHRLFALILLGGPIEALLIGGDPQIVARVVGLIAFALGVAGYRVAGRTLGPALSPLVEPRDDASLVTAGLYRWWRHPMYVSQALIAVGAPLTLGSRVVVWAALPAVAVLAWRMRLEEAALARCYAGYAQYARRAKRWLPFVY